MATYDVSYILKLRDMMSAKLKQADANTKNLHTSVNKLKASMGGLGTGLAGVFAVGAGVGISKDIIQTTARMESLQAAIKFASGSSEEFAKNQEFLRRTNKNLRLETFASAEGFKTLLGSLKGSNLTGQDARDVFDAVGTAARVMGLSAEQQKGAFTALGQIISKGKVQAEELRGQLGERIPGAFAIAAKSLGMTTKELDKALQDGKVSAEEFIRSFAVTLKQEFQEGIPGATKTLSSSLVDIQNKLTDLKVAIGNELISPTNDFIGALGNLVEKLTQNADVIVKVGKFLLRMGIIYAKIKLVLIAVRTAQVAYNASLVLGSNAMKLYRIGLIATNRGLGSMIRLLKLGKIAMRSMFGGAIGVALFAALDLLVEKLMGVSDGVEKVKEANEKLGGLSPERYKAISEIIEKGGNLKTVSKDELNQFQQGLAANISGFKLDPTAQVIGKERVESYKDRIFGWKKVYENQTQVDARLKQAQETHDKNLALQEKVKGLLEQNLGFDGANGGPGMNGSTAGITEIKAAAPKIFNLNIDKLVESLTVQSQTLEEGAERVKEIIEEVLLTALADSQKSVR